MIEWLVLAGIIAMAKSRKNNESPIDEDNIEYTGSTDHQLVFQDHKEMMKYQVQHGYDPRQRVK